MSILKDESNPRTCTACGSPVCVRDEACPTCAVCGKRGHVTCTAALEPVTKIEPGPEIHLGVGVDKTAGQVYLDFETKGGGEKPLKCRVFFSPKEVSNLVRALVNGALVIERNKPEGERQLVVIPTKDGVPIRPTRPTPRPPLRMPGV